MPVPELFFRRDDRDLVRVRLDRSETSIGSDAINDVVVPDGSIPEVAAVLFDRGGRHYVLRDLSRGTLRVNGSAPGAFEVELNHGDLLGLGAYTLRFSVREGRDDRSGRTRRIDRGADTGRLARVIHGDRSFDVAGDRPFAIGSADINDLVLEDEFVSSFHCRITCSAGRWTITDLGSTNGTTVNGLRVREAELPSPANLIIGRAPVRFETGPAAAGAGEVATAEDGVVAFHGLVAKSPKMLRVFELVRRMAENAAPVLVTAQSGSGKELVARALHDESLRGSGPYLALNCGALSGTLIESELFGHVKGAFTGAQSDKQGAFAAANGGTLFLDEVGELPLELQPKLLRALETSMIRPVGGTAEHKVDTRIVAATHRNLKELVAAGDFREDLFHRLFVLNIPIPPLTERPEDVLPLARHFLRAHAPNRLVRLAPGAEQKLNAHRWPGNVRELKNALLRAILMSDAEVLDADDIELFDQAFTSPDRIARVSGREDDEERARILEVLDEKKGNRAEAARALGISKSTFHDKLKRLNVPPKYRPTRK